LIPAATILRSGGQLHGDVHSGEAKLVAKTRAWRMRDFPDGKRALLSRLKNRVTTISICWTTSGKDTLITKHDA